MATTPAPRRPSKMPGLFTPDHMNDCAGSEAGFNAPAPRFAISGESTGRHVIDSSAHETRKRSRPGSDLNAKVSNPHTPVGYRWGDSSLGSSGFDNAKSPPPLANDRYQLAGGVELPEMASRYNGDYDDYFQLEKQRGMWSTVASPTVGLRNHVSPNDMPPTAPGTKPWMLNQIIRAVGGVAGTLVQFCSRPFRGFQAGGGQAYTFGPEGELARTDSQNDPFISRPSEAPPIHAPWPGSFPEDDYGVLSIESLENERPRMAKRVRTGENWVVVDQDGGMDSRPSTPRLSERRVPNHVRSPSQIPRPVSRAGLTGSTPNRPSLIPVSRRSTVDRKSIQGSPKVMANASHSPRSYSRQGYSSPAMFKDTSSVKKSPLPPESQRLINKMRREELEDEARLRRMSSQMSQMLREAQEALGSKVEIEADYAGGCGTRIMDDEGLSRQPPWYHR